jgi:hypothetical protein
LGAIEKAFQDYRRAADVLRTQNDAIWHAGLVENLIEKFILSFLFL